MMFAKSKTGELPKKSARQFTENKSLLSARATTLSAVIHWMLPYVINLP